MYITLSCSLVNTVSCDFIDTLSVLLCLIKHLLNIKLTTVPKKSAVLNNSARYN